MNCEFHLIDGFWVCSHCGRKVKDHGAKPAANCLPPPSMAVKAVRYAHALARHISTGLKNRTDEEVAERLAICQTCDRFNAKAESCSVCGCRCHAGRNALTNKLRMASERCPLGKWD